MLRINSDILVKKNDHQIMARIPGLPIINEKKKRNWSLVYFDDPGEHREKIKESEKIDNYWTLSGNWLSCAMCERRWYQ